MFVDELYPPGTDQVSFMSFMGLFVSARAMKSKTETRFMDFDNFKELMTGKFLPGRLSEYCELSYIPTLEEVEVASKKLQKEISNDDYFGNYNNLIFL